MSSNIDFERAHTYTQRRLEVISLCNIFQWAIKRDNMIIKMKIYLNVMPGTPLFILLQSCYVYIPIHTLCIKFTHIRRWSIKSYMYVYKFCFYLSIHFGFWSTNVCILRKTLIHLISLRIEKRKKKKKEENIYKRPDQFLHIPKLYWI